MKIVNQGQYAIQPSTKKAIENGVADSGHAGDVVLVNLSSNSDQEPVYEVYTLEQEYLFSIDTDGDVIFER